MRLGWISCALVLAVAACGGDGESSAPDPPEDAGLEVTDTLPPDASPKCEPGGDVSTPSSPACDEATVGASQVLTEITVNGVAREFRLTVPDADAGTPLSVLLAFHGGGGRDEPFPQEQAFDALGAEHGVIVAYPLAELMAGNEGEWQLNTHEDTRQDIDFVGAVIDDLSSRYCVDTNRIYATGYSLGSMFTYELACHMNDRFAAITSFAGTMPVAPHACVMTDALPILHLHGSEDGIISYDNEWDWKAWDSVGTMMDIPQLMEFWGAQNGCQAPSWTTTDAGLHVVYDGCDACVRVEHHRIDGLGHGWPSSVNGVPTPELLWSFMSEFTR